jgi:hypothetical protein
MNIFDLPERNPAREVQEDKFLLRHIFCGLKRFSPDFDSETIPHFHAEEFLKIVERCACVGVAIYGVEVFTDQAQLVSVEIAKSDSPSEFSLMIATYCGRERFSICASFGVPDGLLIEPRVLAPSEVSTL